MDVIKIVLGKAYYTQGFFNIRKKDEHKFKEHLSKINIYLQGPDKEAIPGQINRTANTNGTPRIMGGNKMTKWIQANHKKGDILTVELINSSSIRLLTPTN